MSEITGQDEARRALADEIETAMGHTSNLRGFSMSGTPDEWAIVIAALRDPRLDNQPDAMVELTYQHVVEKVHLRARIGELEAALAQQAKGEGEGGGDAS